VTTRRIVAAVAIAFVGFFAFLTVAAALEHGVDLLTIVSLGVLVLLAVGIVGALASGPEE
jgi:hypothetical protein